ncbi:HlyD family efflux transporter periplasmic adaptor subunit [Aliishimia ponticola]|uniref:HlyD family efflux transporter periplasmic adaptor subunit n=1 Tax=Aliishimia ponticola TaxID=2499833 RepID=A0A4S4N5M2_9RHOB|nr:HlyD family efflux transporter periplasmic adaptor subunit [Aliishimia ponticola]THH34389.1 HlyD family efflux transporter periplasmic adaptor subunit [Aliishimia ponticola]
MRFLRQSVMGLFLAAMTLGLLGYAANMVRGAVLARMASEDRAPAQRERVFAVAVQTAVPGRETPVLEAFGEVRAKRTLELRAAASGRIVEMSDSFAEGGVVSEGEVLLRLDPSDAESARDAVAADLSDAEAEVRDAEAALLLAKDELAAALEQAELRTRALQRQQDLAARGVGTAAAVETAELADSAARQMVLASRQAVTQSQARIAQSATRLKRSQLILQDAERRVVDTIVTAPFAGSLSGVSLTLGRLVSDNEQLATLIDPAALEVSFRLSTAQYVRLLDDDGRLPNLPIKARLDVAGVDLVATGRVLRDSAAVGEAESGRLVFAALDGARGFKPGDFVTVSVEEPPIDRVVRLPASAFDGSGTVLAVNDDNRLEALDAQLVRRQGNDVLLRGPELAGRRIVTTRTPLLGPGIAVRPLEGEAQTPDAPDMVELTEERRAKLVAFVEANQRMPDDVKARVLLRLSEPQVPAQMIERLESRMGS